MGLRIGLGLGLPKSRLLGGLFQQYKSYTSQLGGEIIDDDSVKEAIEHAEEFEYLDMIDGWWSPSFGVVKVGDLCLRLTNVLFKDYPDSDLFEENAGSCPEIAYEVGVPVVSFNGINQRLAFFNRAGGFTASHSIGRWIAYAIRLGINDDPTSFFTNPSFASIRGGTTQSPSYLDDWRHTFGVLPNIEYRGLRGGANDIIYTVVINHFDSDGVPKMNSIINSLKVGKPSLGTLITDSIGTFTMGGSSNSRYSDPWDYHSGQMFEFISGRGILTHSQMTAIHDRLASLYGETEVKDHVTNAIGTENYKYPLTTLTGVADCFSFRVPQISLEGEDEVILLRRSSDDDEEWFGYNTEGVLNRAAIELWAGEDTIYIKEITNFGNGNNLIQNVNANQPLFGYNDASGLTEEHPRILFPSGENRWLTQASPHCKGTNDFIVYTSYKGTPTNNQTIWASYDSIGNYFQYCRGNIGRMSVRRQTPNKTAALDNNLASIAISNTTHVAINDITSDTVDLLVGNEDFNGAVSVNAPSFPKISDNTLIIGIYTGATQTGEYSIEEFISLESISDLETKGRAIAVSQSRLKHIVA